LNLVSLWCVNPQTFRSAILTAHRLGFVNGEYVFIYLDTVLTQETYLFFSILMKILKN